MATLPIYGLGLCAGGLGLELGLDIALPGYRTVCVVEREAGVVGRVATRVEEGSLPPLVAWSDVSTFDGRPFRGRVHIVSAGFPCQPFSLAGKRSGTDDARWIWPDIARIIGEVEPELCFLENVPGLLLDPNSDTDPYDDLGEPTNDALGGMGTVLRDLATLGFDAEWGCVRASDVGASHGRNRVFILAYRSSDYRRRGVGGTETGVGEDGLGGRRPSPAERSGGEVEHAPRAGEPRQERESGRGGGRGVRAANDQLGDAAARGRGELREPSGSERQLDGPDEVMGNAELSRQDADEPESGSRNPIGDASRSLPGSSAPRPPGKPYWSHVHAAGRILGNFAPGPADDRWQDVLVRFPWLRPSLSQAEAESYLRDVADGLAALVVNERTGALRALGNGVVCLQAAYAFVALAKRAGLWGIVTRGPN